MKNIQTCELRRGDSEYMHFTPTDFELGEGERLVFTIRELPDPVNSPALLEAVSYDGYFYLSPEATKKLTPGKYSCDIQWERTNGDRFTVWPQDQNAAKIHNWKNCLVKAEVTD